MQTKLVAAGLILIGSTIVGEPRPKSADVFTMRVVDDNGVGVPDLTVTTDNGIVCSTIGNGEVRWSESSLMDRDVRFEVTDARNQFDTLSGARRMWKGGELTLKIHRRS